MRGNPVAEEIRDTISVIDVLEYYGLADGLEDRPNGTFRGPCPLHGGDGAEGFRVNADLKVWKCFPGVCGSGSVIDIVQIIEGTDFWDTCHRLQEIIKEIGLDLPKIKPAPKPKVFDPKPLGFKLQILDDREFLQGRDITIETAHYFGAGVPAGKKTIVAGRFAIPIHTLEGELIAYSGRAMKSTPPDEPKYMLPGGTPTWGMLFNAHRAFKDFFHMRGRMPEIIVAEGFFDVFKIHQAGYPNVVGTFGSSMSIQQAAILKAFTERIRIVYDGDKAGWEGARKIAKLLEGLPPIEVIELPWDADPGGMTEEELRHYL